MMTRICSGIAAALLFAAVAPGLAQTPATTRKTNQVSNPEAVEMLRKLLEQQKAQPDRILRVPATYTNAPVTNPAPAAAKPVKARAKDPAPPAKAKSESAAPKSSKEPTTPAPAPSPAPAPASVPSAEQKMVSEVEQRIETLMRQKEARDKAVQAGGNSKTNAAPAGPLTKRQKLDALLKDYIDGKVTEADYHARRAKLVSEPD